MLTDKINQAIHQLSNQLELHPLIRSTLTNTQIDTLGMNSNIEGQ